MFWIDYYSLVFFDNVDDIELDTELLRNPESVVALDLVPVFFTNSMCVSLDTKTGKEVDTFDIDTLLLDEPGRK